MLWIPLISSCTNSPRIEEHQQQNKACIKGNAADFIGLFFSKSVHVDIQPFPIRLRVPYSQRCVRGGKHLFLVAASRGPGFGANAVIVIKLIEGHEYSLGASYESGRYRFTITDKTIENKFAVYAFDLPEGHYGMNILKNEIVRPPIDLTNRLKNK